MTEDLQNSFSEEERSALAPYFTNVDGPVFALTNLPEAVKGALFARYSRSAKSLRRLFLEEFYERVAPTGSIQPIGSKRAHALYERVFSEYGDDSVAQLGGAHLACEGVSNLLTKVIERGRLAAYLEQSTRYVPYTDKVLGRWKYLVPAELVNSPIRTRYEDALNVAFHAYREAITVMQSFYRGSFPMEPGDSQSVYNRTIRAKALDASRGLLPAATQSNLGIFGSGQAFESLLLRMRIHPLAECRDYAALMLAELRKVIPEFLTRVDQPGRGVEWSHYMASSRKGTGELAAAMTASIEAEQQPEVVLTDFDPNGESKVAAAILYELTDLPDDQTYQMARKMTEGQRLSLIQAYVGTRSNRRHKPGRAFERTYYRFDILADYGIFRDLQRHRLLSIEWQPLSPRHGYITPDDIAEAGLGAIWRRVMDTCAEVYELIRRRVSSEVGAYAVPFAFRMRFCVQMNAREAMHMIELRTSPQGHPSYRMVCQEMHRLIGESAKHKALADAMRFVDYSSGQVGRLQSERAFDNKDNGPGSRQN